MPLVVTDVGSGDRIDIVSLRNGNLNFRTGQSENMFRSRQNCGSRVLSDAETYAELTDWSNGYIRVVPATATLDPT